MCGRFTIAESANSIADALSANALPAGKNTKAPNWNAGPGQEILTLTAKNQHSRELNSLHWGFRLPKGNLIINARLETITEKPTFRPLIERNRCLIPVSGWYEWERNLESKHPWYHTVQGTSILLLAGLWRPEAHANAAIILTRPSLPSIEHIHHRMPVIVPLAYADAWLSDPAFTPPPQRLANHEISATPVSPAVNKIANNSPQNIEPVRPPMRQPSLFD